MPRPHRATLSERVKEMPAKAVQRAEAGDRPLIIKGKVLHIPLLMWAGLAIIVLLGVKLFGLRKSALFASLSLAPVAALWLLPLPSLVYSQPWPSPQPTDNVGWM